MKVVATGGTPNTSATSSRSCSMWPAHTPEPPGDRSRRKGLGGGGGGAGSGGAGVDDRGSRGAEGSTARGGRSRRHHHPDVLRLSGDGHDPPRDRVDARLALARGPRGD